ncbi:MAG TPA: WbqC family protein [Bacteroidales bacterium]|jgi:hypothetical protein|nr:WbqC family protein [Bacteroidales bacterium]
MNQSSILLSTAYLPPIQYITKFLFDQPVFIEKHENYQKQSYRNRCCIYGANGLQSLVIPVKKLHGVKMPVSSVEIDFTMNWKRIHLKSIESAYRLSAFYEYYADEVIEAYKTEIPLLFDWNLHLLNVLLRLCGINKKPAVTGEWQTSETFDFRQSINPKKRLSAPDPLFLPVPYQQVFSERSGFLPNLSIIDLLFNEGPQTLSVLKGGII